MKKAACFFSGDPENGRSFFLSDFFPRTVGLETLPPSSRQFLSVARLLDFLTVTVVPVPLHSHLGRFPFGPASLPGRTFSPEPLTLFSLSSSAFVVSRFFFSKFDESTVRILH